MSKLFIAKSIAGRDKGHYLVTLGVIDENYVLVSDGKLRKVDKPKRKKLKHLMVIANLSESDEKIVQSESFSDIAAAEMISKYHTVLKKEKE